MRWLSWLRRWVAPSPRNQVHAGATYYPYIQYLGDGTAIWYDKAGNVIATIDGVNRKVTYPASSTLDVSAATLTLGAAQIAAASIAAIGAAQLAAGAVGSAALAAQAVGAAALALGADGALTPFPQVQLQFTYPDQATTNIDKVIALPAGAGHFIVVDAWLSSTGANGANANSIQLDNGTGGNHITDAISTNGKAAGVQARAATIDTTKNSIAAGGTLRIVQTKAGGVHSGVIFVEGYLAA